jgi:hypothetical protein
MSSPAQVIRKLLIAASLAPNSQTAAWSPFVSFLPDVPDTAIAVYDTGGVLQGRIMRSGEKIEKPGIQVRLRSSDYPGAFSKAETIRDAIDALTPGTVVEMAPGESWSIQNISRTSPILTTGIEEVGDRKRHNLTINAILTMRKVT